MPISWSFQSLACGRGATGNQRRLRWNRHIVDVEILDRRLIGEPVAVCRHVNRVTDFLGAGREETTTEENERVRHGRVGPVPRLTPDPERGAVLTRLERGIGAGAAQRPPAGEGQEGVKGNAEWQLARTVVR